jgi:hypothetical protein
MSHSLSSREAEDEGGEGFYIAQRGGRADLVVPPRGVQNSNHVDQIFPFPFWRVSVGRRRSPRLGEPNVSRGDLLTHAHPHVRSRRRCGAAAWALIFVCPIELLTVNQFT